MARPARTDSQATPAPVRAALDARVTADLRAAFFEELADVGYGRLSVDSIVRRSGASKAAVYRRWPSKDAMALALVADVAVHAVEIPDTGHLHSDIRRFLTVAQDAMRHPLARRIIPAIAAESQRNPELATLLHDVVEQPRRTRATALLQQAIQRGELPADCDLEQALDLMIGPLYWQVLVRGVDLDADAIDRLADGLVAAMTAMHFKATT